MQKTTTKMLPAIALAMDKASVIDAQNDSPGHATLGLALVEPSFLACYCLFFLLWNVQFWCNRWKKLLRVFACRYYLEITVSSAKCFCFTTKWPK